MLAFVQWEGLEIAIDPVDTPEKSQAVFGTDMWDATVLPLHLILRNSGNHEFEIDSAQIFGVTASGEMAGAYTLQQATDRVRESSIGTTAATGLVLGSVAGAVAGAAIGGAGIPPLEESRGYTPSFRAATLQLSRLGRPPYGQFCPVHVWPVLRCPPRTLCNLTHRSPPSRRLKELGKMLIYLIENRLVDRSLYS